MKKYSKSIFAMLLAAVLLCVASCGKSDIEDESSAVSDPIPMFTKVEYTTFIYEKDGTGGAFTISLGSDGSFDYCEGCFSSYLGHGEWKLEDGIITLTDKNFSGEPTRTNKFRYENDCLTYIAEGSDSFTYVKVTDGDKFPVYDKERDKDKLIFISHMAQTRTFRSIVTDYWLELEEGGTFTCTKGKLNFFLLKGTWSEKDGIVTLTSKDGVFKDEDGKELVARFSYDGKSLTYVAEGSDSDMLSGVSDGDIFSDFSLSEEFPVPAE